MKALVRAALVLLACARVLRAAEPSELSAVAKLVLVAGREEAAASLRNALQSRDPRVRAVAARVMTVSNRTTFGAPLLFALEAETDADAAREEMRGVAAILKDSGREPVIAAARRLRGASIEDAALALARAGCGDAIELWRHELAPLAPGRRVPTNLFGWGARGDRDVLAFAAESALAAGDASAWRAALRIAYRDGVALDRWLVARGLFAAGDEIRAESAWFLALTWRDEPAPGPALRDFAREAAAIPASGDPDELFGLELLRRLSGERGVEDAGWISWLGHRNGTRAQPFPKFLGELLTAREAKAVVVQHELGGASAESAYFRSGGGDAPRPASREAEEVRDTVVRTVTDLPEGVASALIGGAGCDSRSSIRYGLARIRYRDDGRPLWVRLVHAPGEECRDVVGAAFLLAMTPDGRLPSPIPESIVLPVHPAFLEEVDERRGPMHRRVGDEPRTVHEPKELAKARPEYPELAKFAGWQGLVILEAVISARGGVRDVSVLRKSGTLEHIDKLEGSLELASLLAVARWRYRPATFGDEPVPVYLTVTVKFSLR